MICKHPVFSRVFLRFFLSFFSVLMIPLLLLGGISRRTIRDIMNKDESAKKIAALSHCAEGVDNELSNIAAIVFKASAEQEFSPYRMKDFVQNSLSSINRLKSYKTANSFIREIYLFSPYSDYIFSTGSSYTYDRFSMQKIPGSPSADQLPDFLRQTVEAARYGYFPSVDKDAFFLVFPLPNYLLPHYAYMIFEIPKKALLSHFNSVTDSPGSELMVFDGEFLMASSSSASEGRTELLLQAADKLPPGAESGYLDTGKEEIPLFYLTDDTSGLSYILAIPGTDAAAQVEQVIRLFTCQLLLTAFFGTLAIYVLAKVNYSPIRRLVKSTNGLFGGGCQENDEINYLYGFVRKSQSAYRKMNLELKDSLVATKYFFIKNLVNSHPYTPEELADMLERTSMCFEGSCFFAVIFHVHSKSPAITSDIAASLSVFREDGIIGYAAGGFGENIVGLYSCQSADSGSLNVIFDRLRQQVGSKHQVKVTLGIGGTRPNLSEVAASFLEASTALDFRFITGKNKVISFHDLNLDVKVRVDYPQSAMDKICLSIRNGKKELLLQTLTALFADIRSSTYSMLTAKLLCYDVLNMIIKELQNMADSNVGFEVPDLIALSAFETVDELEQMLRRYCETACSFVNSLKPPTLSERAIRLVTRNYAHPDFNVAGISEELGVSSSYLSHIFKEEQSITLNDYIKQYRIGLAKKMLTETTEPLEKIVRLLGYYDCSSFIRMFRKSEGLTPGAYRKRGTDGGE